MSLFATIADMLRSAFARKKRDEEWAVRFTNQPTDRKGKLPLDPGNSELS